MFGPGIRDVAISGNLPGRLAPGIAHTRYFRYGDSDDPDGAAELIRQALALDMHGVLVELRESAPPVDPASVHL